MNPSNMHKDSVLKNKIKVMVIDHKQDVLASIILLLKCHRFQVTSALQAGAALRILTENKENFDLILIDSDMRDVDTFTFLRLTRKMDILSMVMCQETDDELLLEVLENGGFRVLTTPLTNDVVMHIRQDVLRARFHRFEQVIGIPGDESDTGRAESGSHQGTKKRARKRRAGVGRRVCVEWIDQLHTMFLKVYHQLPVGKRYPKDICDAMGVPGLTRLQVASHIQKYKKDQLKKQKGKQGPSSSRTKRLSRNVSNEVDLRMVDNLPNVATHDENRHQIVTNFAGTSQSNATTYVNNQSMTDHFSMMNGNVATHVENHDQIVTNFSGICPSNASTYVNNQSITDFSVMTGNVATHVENHDQIVTNFSGISPSNAGRYVNNQSITDFSVMNGNVATHVENQDQIVANVNGIYPSNATSTYVNNQSISEFVENLEDVYYVPTHFDPNSFQPNQATGFDPNSFRPNQATGFDPNSFRPNQVSDVDPNSFRPNQVSDVDPNSFQPNQISDDFFVFPMVENLPLACMELNESGPNNNYIPEQTSPQCDQVMHSQGTSGFNQHI